jgi:hypothetical protein
VDTSTFSSSLLKAREKLRRGDCNSANAVCTALWHSVLCTCTNAFTQACADVLGALGGGENDV